MIACFFATIMLLVPFTAVAGPIDLLNLIKKPVSKVGIVTNDDGSLSDITDNSPYIIDTSKLTQNELTKLEELKTKISETNIMLAQLEEDYDMEVDIETIEFIEPDGSLIMILPIPMDLLEMGTMPTSLTDNDMNCQELYFNILICSLFAGIFSAACTFFIYCEAVFPTYLEPAALVCTQAATLILVKKGLQDKYNRECKDFSSSNTNLAIDDTYNDCGCQQNIDNPSIDSIITKPKISILPQQIQVTKLQKQINTITPNIIQIKPAITQQTQQIQPLKMQLIPTVLQKLVITTN